MWRNLCLLALSSAVAYVEGGSPQNEALWKACGAEHPTLGYDGGVNAGKGDLAAVKAALAAGADINAKQAEALGATCMMTAGANNYTDILLHLIAEGADLDLTGNTKRSTLMWATRWGHHDVVRLLLGAGADTTITDTSHMDAEKIANAKGMTHIEKILQENIAAKVRAIYKQYAPEKLALVPELMLQYKTPPTMYDWNYDWNSREKAMLEKLEHLYQMPGASDVEDKLVEEMRAFISGQEAEFAAIAAGESERKEKSDKKEAEAKEKKAEAKKKADEKKKAAAAKKAEAKRKAVEAIKAEVTAIYKAHNPNKLSDIDSILTRYKGREKKLLKDLKEKYKNKPPPPPPVTEEADDPASPKSAISVYKKLLADGQGNKGLWQATEENNVEALRLLIKSDKVNVNYKEKEMSGYTSLMWAAANGFEEFLDILLANGADIEMASDTERTPLMFAARWGHIGVVKKLLKKATKAHIGKKDSVDMTAAELARTKGGDDDPIAKLIDEAEKKADEVELIDKDDL